MLSVQWWSSVRRDSIFNLVFILILDILQISVDYISDPSAALERVKTYTKFPVYFSIFISLVSASRHYEIKRKKLT